MQLAARMLRIYVLIGAVLALATWGSLTARVALSPAPQNAQERLIGMLSVQPAAIMLGLVRFICWGPSLALWMWAPPQYSFGLWLAPGLFAGAPITGASGD